MHHPKLTQPNWENELMRGAVYSSRAGDALYSGPSATIVEIDAQLVATTDTTDLPDVRNAKRGRLLGAGRLLVTGSESREIAYVHIGPFTHHLMQRTRVVRVSPNDLVIPQSGGKKYFLLSAPFTKQSLAQLDSVLKPRCRYTIIGSHEPDADSVPLVADTQPDTLEPDTLEPEEIGVSPLVLDAIETIRKRRIEPAASQESSPPPVHRRVHSNLKIPSVFQAGPEQAPEDGQDQPPCGQERPESVVSDQSDRIEQTKINEIESQSTNNPSESLLVNESIELEKEPSAFVNELKVSSDFSSLRSNESSEVSTLSSLHEPRSIEIEFLGSLNESRSVEIELLSAINDSRESNNSMGSQESEMNPLDPKPKDSNSGLVNEPGPLDLVNEPAESAPLVSVDEPEESAPLVSVAEPAESAPLVSVNEPAESNLLDSLIKPKEYTPLETCNEPAESPPLVSVDEPKEYTTLDLVNEPAESAPLESSNEPAEPRNFGFMNELEFNPLGISNELESKRPETNQPTYGEANHDTHNFSGEEIHISTNQESHISTNQESHNFITDLQTHNFSDLQTHIISDLETHIISDLETQNSETVQDTHSQITHEETQQNYNIENQETENCDANHGIPNHIDNQSNHSDTHTETVQEIVQETVQETMQETNNEDQNSVQDTRPSEPIKPIEPTMPLSISTRDEPDTRAVFETTGTVVRPLSSPTERARLMSSPILTSLDFGASFQNLSSPADDMDKAFEVTPPRTPLESAKDAFMPTPTEQTVKRGWTAEELIELDAAVDLFGSECETSAQDPEFQPGVRFAHPLIPASHVHFYTSDGTVPSPLAPRRSTLVGPHALRTDVQTVSGYVSWLFSKGT